MVDIFLELQKFNWIKFEEELHTYTYDTTKKLISTTTFLKKFVTSFDEEYWSTYKALQANNFEVKSKADTREFYFKNDEVYLHIDKLDEGFYKDITPQTFLKQWKDKADVSSNLGTNVHSYIEWWYNNKIYNSTNIIDKSRYDNSIRQFTNFYNRTKDILIPIKSELVVGDLDTGIGGMIDKLFWNTQYNELQIFDWKTNEEIGTENRWNKLKSIFKFLDECEFNKYSIQLNIYKKIIQKNTNLKIGGCYVIHLNGKEEDNFKMYKMLDLQEQIDIIFNKIKEKRAK